MEFDVAVFKGTDLYQNLTQSQKEYTIKVLDDVRSYKAISESKLEISKEFGDRFRTGGEWDVKKKSYDVREGVVSNEYLGNFMYGLAGSVLGIEDKILVSAAAGQQQLKNKGKDIIGNIEGSSRKKLMIATAFEYFNGWFKSVKNNKYDLLFFGEGDNPGDTQKIIDGINIAKKCGIAKTPINTAALFTELAKEKIDTDTMSYFFNIYDTRWQDKDPKLMEEFKIFWQDSNSLKNAIDTLSYFFNPFDENFPNILQDAQNFYSQFLGFTSISLYDPLILDLNGNGKIDLTSTSNGVHFDHDANDISFKSSWVDKEDGLLVYDRNNNGIIDNGTELFGNFTRIASANTNSSAYKNIDDANKNDNNLQTNNTTLAKHGYEALANLDSNNDGVIDINDKDFNKLRIWQDINKDGVSQINELKTLDELNIKSLNLNYKEINQDLGDNNTLTLKGSYTKTNGQTMLMGDINFNVDTINSKFKEDINLTTSQTKIPNVKGYGYLRDLNKAASIDTNLANILDNYSKSNTKEEQLKILPTLIKAWSDTSNNINNNLNPIEEPNNNDTDKTKDQRAYDISLTKIKLPNNISISDGTNVKVDSSGNIVSNDHKSARNLRLTPSQYRALMGNNQEIDKNLALEFESIKDKIRVIDAFSGQKTTALNYIDPSEVRAIIDNVNTTYDKILSHIYSSLLPQTRLKEYVSLIDIKAKEAKDENGNVKYEFSMDYSKVIGKFEETIKKDAKKAFMDIGEFINLLRSSKNSSNITSLTNIFGELIRYASKNNLLEDFKLELATYNNINILTTSKDSNTVRGSGGNDTLYGGEGNDSLYGGEGEDNLYGNEGDDRLYGEKGNDILNGGAGNDYLDGGIGDDIYTFNKGDGIDTVYDTGGADTIKFGEGISKEDLIVSKINDGWWDNTFDMVIRFKGREGDMLTIKDVYADAQTHSTNNAIERFEFSDGSTITLNELEANVMFKGTNGNDVIHGLNTNDIITGLEGDDVLNGYDGDDALYGNEGNDTLYSHSGNDTLYGG